VDKAKQGLVERASSALADVDTAGWTLRFDLLSDPGNDYAAKLGLRFKLPDDLKAVYLSFGIDLAAHNREGSWTLPMPGRFVIDRGGIVHAVDVEPDYQYRPEPQKTVDDVKALA